MVYYFDNSATTQPSDEMLDIAKTLAKDYFANPSSAHKLGVQAQQLLTSARKQIASILNFEDQEIYFVSSGTEANNFVFQGVLPQLAQQRQGRKVLISSIEHPATMRQVDSLAKEGYDLDLIPVDSEGQIDIQALRHMLDHEVLLISTIAINNEVGSVQPLDQIAEILRDYPQIIWHVDGVQAVTTHLNLLNQARMDLLSLSSHKFHGIRGAGILAKRERVPYQPLLYGGGQERNLRSSTENLVANVVAARALRIAYQNQEDAKMRLESYRNQLVDSFEQCGWQTFARDSGSPHILCVALPSIPGEVLLHAFEAKDVYVSTTSACSSRSHQEHATLHAMGVDPSISQSAVRISMAHTTTQEEVDYLIRQIPVITSQFKARK